MDATVYHCYVVTSISSNFEDALDVTFQEPMALFKPMAPMHPVNHPFHVTCDCLEPWRMTFEHSQEGRTFWGPSLWINILASICNSEAKEKLEPRPRVFRLACMWQQTGVARRQLTYAPKSPLKVPQSP